MTRQKSFKRLVRARMQKTGERYATARAALLAAVPDPSAEQAPVLATSDANIVERTGRGWEQWFDLLDAWGARDRTHRDIARWVAEQLGIEPLAWNAQAITVSYERARRARAVGEHAEGFAVTASKTVAVPVERLFEAFCDTSLRKRWLPDEQLRVRTATKPRAAHFDWDDGPTRVHVTFSAKDDRRSTTTVEHARLADAQRAERVKAYWRDALAALKAELEAGETNA